MGNWEMQLVSKNEIMCRFLIEKCLSTSLAEPILILPMLVSAAYWIMNTILYIIQYLTSLLSVQPQRILGKSCAQSGAEMLFYTCIIKTKITNEVVSFIIPNIVQI